MSNSPRRPALLSRARHEIAALRTQRAQRRQLEKELRSYTTDAEIHDLLGTFETEEGVEADTARSILFGNVMAGTDLRRVS